MMYLRAIIILLVISFSAAAASPLEKGKGAPAGKILGKIPMTTTRSPLDSRARREIDGILPQLTAEDSGLFFCLEGHAGGTRNREEYVKISFNLAKEVERYLRVERGVKAEMYLAVAAGRENTRSRNRFVHVVAYPSELKERKGLTWTVTGKSSPQRVEAGKPAPEVKP